MADSMFSKQTSRRALLKGLAISPLVASTKTAHTQSQPTAGSGKLPRITVHKDGHFLQTEDGQPFFWLGDTAWELIHHTTREEASYYLHTRARQRFTVIQTVVLSEFEGVTTPSALGLKPFLDAQYRQPNPAYFQRVVEVVEEAASLGLYIALVATWGDKLTAPWGAGPRLFATSNLPDARAFAMYLGVLLRNHTNVIWMLGGDRPARLGGVPNRYAAAAGFPPDQDWTSIWREIAAGLADGLQRKPLVIFHPQGGEYSSSVQLPHEDWLSVNGMQSGHGSGHDVPVWKWIARDYTMNPLKPTLDLEPNYEDHPVNPWPTWNPATGYFRDYDVRRQTYRSVFAGACGVTYGHHAVWGFINERNQPINHSDMDWITAMQRPGAQQMQFLRDLIESRPFFRRIPDQGVIVGDTGEGSFHVQATRDTQGTFAFIYIPVADRTVRLRLDTLTGKEARVWWYDPRTGIATVGAPVPTSGEHEFSSPSYGPDWILVLDTDPHVLPPGLLEPAKERSETPPA